MVLVGAVENIIPVHNYKEIFEKGAEAGLDCIELRYRSDLPISQLKELSTTFLPISSLMMGVLWEYNLASQDEAVRSKGVEALKDGISIANILGFRDLLVVPGVGQPDLPYRKIVERASESLSEVVKIAEDKGVYLCIENVGNGLFYSPTEFASFVKSFKSDNVKAYFDFANAYYCGLHPEWFIEELRGSIKLVHVKNWDTSRKSFIPLSERGINFKAIFSRLRSSGYRGPFIMEISGNRERAVEFARENVLFLREQLKMAGY
ncbi:MAG: sugar phosphate isomerase/epimerase family protein [Thermoproteota archaeon]